MPALKIGKGGLGWSRCDEQGRSLDLGMKGEGEEGPGVVVG